VTETLPVHLNRQELHSLEVPASFETDDSFVIEVENHGEASRVHVHLDDGLSEIASIDESNHYVEARSTHQVPVTVHEKRDTFGKIKMVSGYGAVTHWIDVELTETGESGVEVDEELAEPQPRDPEPEASLGSAVTERPGLPVLALGVVALLVAGIAIIVVESTVVTAGAVVVIAAVLVAGALLLR